MAIVHGAGRCGVCGLEATAWSGDGVRLCEACYRREVRRGLEAGADALAPAQGSRGGKRHEATSGGDRDRAWARHG